MKKEVAEAPSVKSENLAIPTQEEKIVIFQLVSPNSCLFLCVSADEENNKLDLGCIRR